MAPTFLRNPCLDSTDQPALGSAPKSASTQPKTTIVVQPKTTIVVNGERGTFESVEYAGFWTYFVSMITFVPFCMCPFDEKKVVSGTRASAPAAEPTVLARRSQGPRTSPRTPPS